MNKFYNEAMRQEFWLLKTVVKHAKDYGMSDKMIAENERIQQIKRRIRRKLKSNGTYAVVRTIQKPDNETWIDIYDIETPYETSKEEFIKEFWREYAKTITADYSPTGMYFTSDFRCAYKGRRGKTHVWHCHEYISIDV